MTLPQIAFVLFCAIALGGLLIAILHLCRIPVPAVLPPLHGLGGLTAAGLLLYANLAAPAPLPPEAWWAFGVLAASLLGGGLFFGLMYRRARPFLLIAGHGSLGVIGLVLLYLAAF